MQNLLIQIWRNGIAEFIKSPIGATAGLVTIIGLATSVSTIAIREPSRQTVANASSAAFEIDLNNILIVLTYFVSLTILCAIISRRLAKKNSLMAVFVSITLTALTNFSSIIIIYMAPPRTPNHQLFASAHDVLLYASTAIYLAICGQASLRALALPGSANGSDSEKHANSQDPTLGGVLMIAALLLAIWIGLVFKGQTMLTNTFLPEMTYASVIKCPQ